MIKQNNCIYIAINKYRDILFSFVIINSFSYIYVNCEYTKHNTISCYYLKVRDFWQISNDEQLAMTYATINKDKIRQNYTTSMTNAFT